MVEKLKIGGIYQHYKGMNYRVLGLGRHSESLEWMVYYQCLYKNDLGEFWVRPLDMFSEIIEIEGRPMARFQLISE